MRVELECLKLAGRFGSMRWYGAAAAATAAEALLWLGRLEEAERLLDEVLDLDLSPNITRTPLLSRGLQRLWLGDLQGARADLTWILERSKASMDPQDGAPTRARLVAVATWQGRLEDAPATTAEGLALLGEVDEADFVIDLCLADLAAEAAIAERAAARRTTRRATRPPGSPPACGNVLARRRLSTASPSSGRRGPG